MRREASEKNPSGLLQGTLDMLILKTLDLEPMHGYGSGARLEQISRGALQINAGSLFPAFRRLERDGLIKGEWRGRATLRRETQDWEQQAAVIARILRSSPARS
jgi:DNA-binding PadR family transcriptional regulator